MNDFVKSIVDEVIKKPSGNTSAPPVSRPNYQREKAKTRLVTFDLKPDNFKSDYSQSKASPLTKSYDNSPRNLGVVSLSAGNAPYIKADTSEKLQAFSMQSKKPLQTDCETQFTVIDNADKRIFGMMKLSVREGHSIGMAFSKACTLSQLFAIDCVLDAFPSLDYQYSWADSANAEFSAKLCGEGEKIQKAIALMREKCSDDKKLFLAEKPSEFLIRALKLSSRGIAAISGINEIEYVPLIDEYFKNSTDSVLEFIPFRNGLVAQGDFEEAKRALTGFLNRK